MLTPLHVRSTIRRYTQQKKPRFVIDAHTHILPATWEDPSPKYGYQGFINYTKPRAGKTKMMLNGELFREVDENCFNTRKRLHDCQRYQIDLQVICTVPVMFNYWAKPKHTHELSMKLNDDLAQTIQEHPKQYVGLGTIPMNDPILSMKELRRCIETLGFAGIQIGSHINDKTLADPSFFPIFELAQELNAAILVHPWDMTGKELMKKYWLPWLVGMPAECSFAACSLIFGGVMKKLPKLRVCLSHGGGSFPWTIGRIEHGYNVRPDLVAIDNPDDSPRNYLKRFYYDAHVCDSNALQELIHLVGEDRIMLGSDYPFPLGESPPGSLLNSMDGISQETRDQIFYKTACEWLGIDARQYNSIYGSL